MISSTVGPQPGITGILNRGALRRGFVLFDINLPLERVLTPPALPEIAGFPERVFYRDKEFRLKSEFHVTLITASHKLARRLQELRRHLRLSPTEAEERVREGIGRALCAAEPFRFQLGRNYYQVAKDGRATIILDCYVDGADRFFSSLWRHSGLEIEVPPTHITLYMHGQESLGLLTYDQLQAFTQGTFPLV